MNINSLTIKAQEALQGAVSLAKQHGQQAVEPMHLLAVLVREDDSLASFLLGRVGVNVRGLRDEASRAVASLPRVEAAAIRSFRPIRRKRSSGPWISPAISATNTLRWSTCCSV